VYKSEPTNADTRHINNFLEVLRHNDMHFKGKFIIFRGFELNSFHEFAEDLFAKFCQLKIFYHKFDKTVKVVYRLSESLSTRAGLVENIPITFTINIQCNRI